MTIPQTRLFGAAAVYKAIGVYQRTGIMVHRSYTPKAMIAAAAAYTGKTIGGRGERGLREAAAQLRRLLVENGWPLTEEREHDHKAD